MFCSQSDQRALQSEIATDFFLGLDGLGLSIQVPIAADSSMIGLEILQRMICSQDQ